MRAPHALYRTADGKLCNPTDPKVAYLVCAAGAEVPVEFVDQLNAPAPEPEPEVAVEAEAEAVDADEAPEPAKQAEPAPNKKAPTARNKRA